MTWRKRLLVARLFNSVLVIILILASLSIVLLSSGCGDDGGNGEGDSAEESGDVADEMEKEKERVQEGINRYMKRTGKTEIEPRETPVPIQPWETGMPFKSDIPGRLPTKFRYAWDAQGNITAVTLDE